MKRILAFLLTCVVAMGTMTQLACTPTQKLAVVQDIQKFLPVVTNVAESVCAFDAAAPVCVAGVTAVTASASVLITALDNYYTAEASGAVPPGIVAALNQAVTTFEADASAILDAVHVLNPTLQAEIQAIVASAQVLLALVETLLPSNAASSKFAASKPASFDANAFAGDYNAKVSIAQHFMPRTTKLKKVHVHSIFVRWASAGHLN